MGTKQNLEDALKNAMRASDETRKRVIRLMLASIKMAEIEKGAALEETDLTALVQKDIKMRHEAIEGAEKAGRQDLIEINREEIRILEEFLPEQLAEEEIKALVQSAIDETGASNPSDMGKVMKTVLPRLQGRAANDVVSRTVRELLNK